MITTVYNEPYFYTAAWGPIVYSCLSDQIQYIGATGATQVYNFKYVYDIYSIYDFDEIGPNRFLVEPNPAGAGVIDIQNFIQGNMNISYSVQHEVLSAIGGTSKPTTFFLNLAPEIFGVFWVVVGEMYSTSPTGTLSIYNGLTNSSTGGPAYPLYTNLDGTIWENSGSWYGPGPTGLLGVGVSPIPGSFNMNQAYENYSQGWTASNPFGFYSNYTMPSAIDNISLGLFLSEKPQYQAYSWPSYLEPLNGNNYRAAYVYPFDHETLTFINFNANVDVPSGMGGTAAGFVQDLYIERYSTTGLTGSSITIPNDTAHGGINGATGVRQYLYNGAYLESVLVGPQDLLNQNLNYLNGVSSYTVQLTGYYNNTGLIGQVSETILYNIVSPDPTAFERIRFSWLNKLGGRDYYNFIMYYEQSYSQSSNAFWKDANNWSSATWGLTPWNSGNVPFSKTLTNSIVVTTDYLNIDNVVFLKSLFDSPSVHVYQDSSGNYPTQCIIKDVNYKVIQQLLPKDKLTQITFIVELGIISRVQTS